MPYDDMLEDWDGWAEEACDDDWSSDQDLVGIGLAELLGLACREDDEDLGDGPC